jgi:hypothetical protein
VTPLMAIWVKEPITWRALLYRICLVFFGGRSAVKLLAVGVDEWITFR